MTARARRKSENPRGSNSGGGVNTRRQRDHEHDLVTERDDLIETALRVDRPDDEAILLVGRFPSFHPLDRIRMLVAAPTIDALCGMEPVMVEQTIGRTLRSGRWEPKRLLESLAVDRRWLSRGDDRFVMWIGDSAYPKRLLRLHDPPGILYGYGNRHALAAVTSDRPVMALVGTRRPDDAGRVAAHKLGRTAATAGVTVVSGLARGIDGAAHRGVVNATSPTAPPVVILGSGIDDIYPSDHRELALDILRRGGVILSEYAPGFPPKKHQFPARNRIIAALSDGVVVVQAPERSGALISANLAGDIGIDVVVHRVGAGWTGGKQLVTDGAPVVEDIHDVAAQFGWNVSVPDADSRADAENQGGEIDESRRAILSAFGDVEPPASVAAFRAGARRSGGATGREPAAAPNPAAAAPAAPSAAAPNHAAPSPAVPTAQAPTEAVTTTGTQTFTESRRTAREQRR